MKHTYIYFISIICIQLISISPSLFAQEKGVISNVLPSIVIIDTERISYNSPFDQNSFSDLFYPFDLDTQSGDPNGDGITRKNVFGSGSIFKKEKNTYYIMTNNHVVENASSLWITTYDGYIHQATLIGTDAERDIAVVSFVSARNYTLIEIGDYRDIYEGMPVYAIGVPFGFTYTVSRGIVSSLDKSDSSLKNIFIQTDASMNPGNSGGALVDEKGLLIGVSTWIYSPKGSSSIGINFASSINTAMDVAESILAGESDTHAWIGIVYDSFSPILLNKMNFNYRLGAIITSIVDDSPADKAGLQIGDMIISVGGTKLRSFNSHLTNATAVISTIEINVPASFKILRNNEHLTINITPIETPKLETHDAFTQMSQNIWPGMNISPLEDYKREILGISTSDFVLYAYDILPNSPAYAANIQENDVIVEINGTKLKNYNDYIKIINEYRKNQKIVRFTIFQNGNYIEKSLKR